MNRLIQMAGLVPAILSVLCACQHPARRRQDRAGLESYICQPAFLHARSGTSCLPCLSVNICDFRSEERWCDAEHGSDK